MQLTRISIIFPCINYADLIDQTPKFKLIIFLYLFFYFLLYVLEFQSKQYQSTWSYTCLMSLPIPKLFRFIQKVLELINQSTSTNQSLIQSINQYIPVCFYVYSINIKCILTFPFHIHSRSNLVGGQCRHLMLCSIMSSLHNNNWNNHATSSNLSVHSP